MKLLGDIYSRCCSTRQNHFLLHIVMILIVGVAIYANSFTVPFILDDYYSLDFYGKKELLEHILHGGSRRVADFTFALNYRIHGLRVAGYHFTNLVIHLSSSLLLYFIMASILSAFRVSFSANQCTSEKSTLLVRFLPLAVALLFVVHPIQTQAVTYIIQRYTSLATFFYLLAIISFLRARLTLECSGFSCKTVILSLGTISAWLFALGCKQIAVTLPCMLLLLEIFLFRGRLINRRFYVACGVFVIITISIVLYKYQGNSLNDFLFDLHHATAEDQRTPRTTYFLTQTRVVATYLGLLCLPIDQSLVHDSPIYKSIFSVPVLLSLALHILLFATATILFITSRQKFLDGAWLFGVLQRLVSMGIIWFYIGMALESSIFPIIDVMFEHRIYLPSVGFFMAVTSLSVLIFQGRQHSAKILWGSLSVVCLLYGSMTISRNKIWNNPLALWQEAVYTSPNKWLAQANLANEYMARKMPEKAIPIYIRTMELNPALFFMTKVNLGEALRDINVFGSRFTTGREYILPGGILGSGQLDYKNLSKWESVIGNNMGLAYEYLKEPEKALRAYRLSVTLNPEYDLGWYNLALISAQLGNKGQVDEAVRKLNILNPALAKDVLLR